MTPLRQRMLDALQVRGMAVRTQQAYIDVVARLARHYARSPEALSPEQVQAYLLYLRRERQRSCSTLNQYGCAFRFLYATVLGRDGAAFQIPLTRTPQRLPELLSRDELARLFAAACHAQSRSFLMLGYGTGQRLSELCHLRAEHIDSAADRRCIRVEQGKGAKDRYVPLAADVLTLLRDWWRAGGQPRQWLFASSRNATKPLDADCTHAGITKRGGIHTLRHCYATHLLEAGVDLHSLSQWLGHKYVSTTTRYLHLARPDAPDGARRDPLALLGALPKAGMH